MTRETRERVPGSATLPKFWTLLDASNCRRNEKAIAVTPAVSLSITPSPSRYIAPSCYTMAHTAGIARTHTYVHTYTIGVSHMVVTRDPGRISTSLDVGTRRGVRRRGCITNASALSSLARSPRLSFFSPFPNPARTPLRSRLARPGDATVLFRGFYLRGNSKGDGQPASPVRSDRPASRRLVAETPLSLSPSAASFCPGCSEFSPVIPPRPRPDRALERTLSRVFFLLLLPPPSPFSFLTPRASSSPSLSLFFSLSSPSFHMAGSILRHEREIPR